MSLHLYNTLTRTLEVFKPLKQDEVKIYYCGPTPYNYAHIGNLRTYLYEDFVVRTLRFLGYKVKTVMNITDIEDKTIRDSQKSGKSLKEFTEFYADAFLQDLDKLSIVRADTIAPISTLIDEMGVMIQGLIKKGYAYLADDGSIYYSVSKFRKYGELAHLDMSGMISSVRIDNDEYEKDQVADFALWKAYDAETDGQNWWEIEVSVIPGLSRNPAQNNTTGFLPTQEGQKQETIKLKGRPGWHIECSACNYRFFGEQIDIHMGGIDNLFPHHQNEVAQTEAFTGKQFAKYWMHGGHLLVDNKKMAKSAGNFYTLRDIVEKMNNEQGIMNNWEKKTTAQNGGSGVGTVGVRGKTEDGGAERTSFSTPDGFGTFATKSTENSVGKDERIIYRGFRLMGLQNQYRENFNFTFERLTAAINTIKGLDEMMKRVGRYIDILQSRKDETGEIENETRELTKKGRFTFHTITREFRENQQYFMQEFVEKLENDFDTNSAMTIIFEFQGYVNSAIDEELFSLDEAKSVIDLLRSWNEVIAILDFSLLESESIPKEIEALAVARSEAKLQKNWVEADIIRDELASLGWKMIDEKNGWRVEKI